MANHNEPDSSRTESFRTEAQPVKHWDRLTEDQQIGLQRLLEMVTNAVERRQGPQGSKHLPWLFAENKMQLAFIDGKRGTGKTTLMTTLAATIDNPKTLELSDRSSAEVSSADRFGAIIGLAKQLKNLVITVQPLDMEPLPKGTPLLAAILARVYRAAKEYGGEQKPRASLLADDPQDQREMLTLYQYRNRVAKTLDSNLDARKGGLDPEQFAEAVLSEEDDRLELVSDLEKVLGELARRIRRQVTGRADSYPERQLLFLIPIDDIDLNPDRCVELLQLLRTFSPPRELFFLLMGDYERVESIVKLQMAAEYGQLWKKGKLLSTESDEDLRNDIATVSTANVRKMIPPHQRIELVLPSLPTTLQFRPLSDDGSVKVPVNHDSDNLVELLGKIHLPDGRGKPGRFTTMLDLLSQVAVFLEEQLSDKTPPDEPVPGTALINDASRTRQAAAFCWNQYCGPGAFQVPARRLVDLWIDLHDVSRNVFPTSNTEQQPLYTVEKARFVHELMQKHWLRVVDADPLLSRTARRRLKLDGPQACRVIQSDDAIYEEDLEIAGAEISISTSESTGPILYHARLRVAALRPGTGVPLLELVGPGPRRDDSAFAGQPPVVSAGSAQEKIESIPTRCAKVLYHDLNDLFEANTKTANTWPDLTSIAPVALSWVGPEGEIAKYPWPLPPLTTFVDMSRFLARWHAYYNSPARIARMPSSSEASTITVDAVAELIRVWVILGLRSVEESLKGTLESPSERSSSTEEPEWEEIPGRMIKLRNLAMSKNHLRGWTQIDKWLRRIAQLAQPEICSPAVSRVLISAIERISQDTSLRELHSDTVGILRNQRQQRLAPLWRNARELWLKLNVNPDQAAGKSSWLFVAVPEPAPEDESEVLVKLGEMEQRLEEKIDQMQKEQRISFLQVEYQSLMRQGDLAKEEDPATAARLYQQALETAQVIAGISPSGAAMQRNCSRAFDKLGLWYLDRNQLDPAEKIFSTELAINRRLVSDDPESIVAQRDLSVSLDRLGEVYESQDLAKSARVLAESLKIRRRLVSVDPESPRARHDLSLALNRIGDVYQLQQRWQDAIQAFTESSDICRNLASANPESAKAPRTLALTLDRLGDLYEYKEQWDEATLAFMESMKIRRQMVSADSENPKIQCKLAFTLNRLGDVLYGGGHHNEAEVAYKEALELSERLVQDYPLDKRFQRELAKSLWNQASVIHPPRLGNPIRRRAWEILSKQDLLGIFRDTKVAKIYDDLKAEFDSLANSRKAAAPPRSGRRPGKKSARTSPAPSKPTPPVKKSAASKAPRKKK